MKNAGGQEALKEIGIGTPATRAGIIGTLFQRDYIERSGKSIVPTEKGLNIYEVIKDMRIADLELTGSWEKTLGDIGDGTSSPETFMEAIKIYTNQITTEILALKLPQSGSNIPKPKRKTARKR